MKALKRLENYFVKERSFDSESFCKIISTERTYTYGIDKIKTMEETFRNHCYSEDEIKTIETGSPEALGGNEEVLDKKLSFYGAIGIKNLIINHPTNLRQGLELSYARHKHLSALNLFDNHEKDLFIPESRFVSAYEIDNQTLKEKYPVDARYLVKK